MDSVGAWVRDWRGSTFGVCVAASVGQQNFGVGDWVEILVWVAWDYKILA